MRPPRLRPVPALLLVAVVAAGCGGGSEPTDPVQEAPSSSTAPTTDEPTAEAGGGPVPGAGADVDPGDAEAWCGAVTAEQLSSAGGWAVDAVDSYGTGLDTCSASLPDSEVTLTWGSEETTRSFDAYASGFDEPEGAYDVSRVDVGDRPALVALQPSATTAFAGTVADGRLTQVTVIGLLDRDADPAVLGEVARQVLAVYTG